LVIVDSGSDDTTYLNRFCNKPNVKVIARNNIGFCCANNIGIDQLGSCDFVLLINPDARAEVRCIEGAMQLFQKAGNEDVGAVSVPLIRYDWANRRPMNVYDSLGITMRWYGRWTDVGKDEPVVRQDLNAATEIEAACGAFLLLRRRALEDSAVRGAVGFDPTFVMYKEDIELSLRLRRKGWRILRADGYTAYHCRGWQSARKTAPQWARELSARNDVKVALRGRWKALPFALAKCLWVGVIERVLYRASESMVGPTGCV
jgi:GT2 family glycosyltransferase